MNGAELHVGDADQKPTAVTDYVASVPAARNVEDVAHKPMRSRLVNTMFHDRYFVHLPKTADGFMIQIEVSVTNVPFVENYYVALLGYRKHPGDVMSEAEKEGVITPGDILLAVDDIDVKGLDTCTVKELIESKTTADNCMLKMTWLNKSLFNSMRRKSFSKGTVTQPMECSI